MAYGEKQNAEGDEEEISTDDDGDEDEVESCDDGNIDSEPADQSEIHQSDSCLEHSSEIMAKSSVGKLPASEVVMPTNDAESLMKYQADDSISEADHDEHDDEESFKMSNSDGDCDVLVITFGEYFVLFSHLECMLCLCIYIVTLQCVWLLNMVQ